METYRMAIRKLDYLKKNSKKEITHLQHIIIIDGKILIYENNF